MHESIFPDTYFIDDYNENYLALKTTEMILLFNILNNLIQCRWGMHNYLLVVLTQVLSQFDIKKSLTNNTIFGYF
jgi:hypothetical protein